MFNVCFILFFFKKYKIPFSIVFYLIFSNFCFILFIIKTYFSIINKEKINFYYPFNAILYKKFSIISFYICEKFCLLIPNCKDLIIKKKKFFYNMPKCPVLNAREWIYIHKTWINHKVVYKMIPNYFDNNIDFIKNYINYDYDYIIYTENLISYLYNLNQIWQYYPLPEKLKKEDNDIKNQIILKVNPNLYLPSQYNYSIYIKSNIIIKYDINFFKNELNKKFGNFNLYLSKNQKYNCIYDIIRIICLKRKEKIITLIPQIEKYINDNFPHNYGLYKTNILIRNHKNQNIIKLMNNWEKNIFNGSLRDELSLPYVIWKNNFSDFASFNKNIFNIYFSKFKIKKKNNKRKVIKRKKN